MREAISEICIKFIHGNHSFAVQELSGWIFHDSINYIVIDYFTRRGLSGIIDPIDYSEANQRVANGQFVLVSIWDTYWYENSGWEDGYNASWDGGDPIHQSGDHWVTITGYDEINERFIISTYGRKGYIIDKDHNTPAGGFWALDII